jgi:hypothetical protein
MNDELTRGEAATFAVAIYNAVKAAYPMTPSIVIEEVARRIDFKSGDIEAEVFDIVEKLRTEWPTIEVKQLTEGDLDDPR